MKLKMAVCLITINLSLLYAPNARAQASGEEAYYDEKSFELNSVLFGARDIGANFCKPAGKKMPASLSGWFSAIKTYSEGEINRDRILNGKIEALKLKLQDLQSKKPTNELQIEVYQVQIDVVDASIESVGEGTGRIGLREKLLLACLESIKANTAENLKMTTTYKKTLIASGLNASLKVAQDACKRKKMFKECTLVDDVETDCKEVEKPSPVNGCEAASKTISAMLAGPVQQYGDLYLMEKVPSKELNEKMGRLEDKLKEQMKGITKSDDSKYDWSTPMEKGLEAMKLARLDSGAICPSTADKKSYDREVLDTVATEGATQQVLGADKISEKSVEFMTLMGVTNEEDLKKASGALTDSWNLADLVIGQPGNRGKYFAETQELINSLLGMDYAKLKTLYERKIQLMKLLEASKKMLTPSGSGGSSSKSSSSTSAEKAKEKNGAVQTNESVSASIGVDVSAKIAEIDGLMAGAVKINSKTGLGDLSVSGSGVSGFAGNLSTGDGLNLGAVNKSSAAKTINETKAIQGQTPEFTLPNSGKSALKVPKKASVSYADSIKGVFADANQNGLAKKLYNASAISGLRALENDLASGGGSSAKSILSSTPVSSSKAVKTTVTDLGYSKSSSDTPADSTESAPVSSDKKKSKKNLSADSRILSESILAKKSKRPTQYDSSEDDSLFERVTKAYIRNYEKVEE